MKNTSITFIDIVDLDESLKKLPLKDTNQTLIQIFCANSSFDFVQKIQNYFQKKFTNACIIGTTTDGIIEDCSVYKDEVSLVSFTLFANTTLTCELHEHENCYNTSYETGKVIAQKLRVENTKALISFTDGIHTNGEEYLAGINAVDKSLLVAGGLSADNGKMETTYIFNNEKITSNGAVAVALNSDCLKVSSSYNFEWMPIGKKLEITKAVKNRIYEINHTPVVEIYAKYMGKELAQELPKTGVEFPLIFEKNGVSIGRAPLLKHDDGSLTFAGNIQEGEFVRFGVGNIDLIVRNSDYNLKQILGEIKYETQSVFVYSCMARRRFMNEYVEKELEILTSLGDVVGFFTYGEFYHSDDSNQLLNQTMTVLMLSESEEESRIEFSDVSVEHEFSVNTGHVLAHLANTVSNELAELNENLEKRVEESSSYIYQQAYYDKLTSLPNRLSLIKKLNISVGKILFLVNIDDFTIINDFYGHDIGDQVLVHLAETLQNHMKHHDAEVFKLPSDEYAIIMDINHNQQDLESEIKEILQLVEHEEFLFNGHCTHVSVTLSAAFINKKGTGLINADMSLKLAKKARKDFMIFGEDLKLAQQYENNITVAKTIKDAINNDTIIPYFQSMYDVKTLKIKKYEALVRLVNNEGEVLSPYIFLDISQKIKLYPQITEIMMEKVFSLFQENGLDFSINLAFSDITNTKTRALVFSKIKKYKIASQLTIEILENQEIDNIEIMFDFINEVYGLGAKIAIDDFGSGFANFEYMTKIRCDYMKIDGSLIKNIDTDANARLVVETIVVFAKKLGKITVAEFVHSKEVFDVVKELGIDYAQGYYLAKPSATLTL
jgi:diguanylate cyclase (GGDEF)-like protein